MIFDSKDALEKERLILRYFYHINDINFSTPNFEKEEDVTNYFSSVLEKVIEECKYYLTCPKNTKDFFGQLGGDTIINFKNILETHCVIASLETLLHFNDVPENAFKFTPKIYKSLEENEQDKTNGKSFSSGSIDPNTFSSRRSAFFELHKLPHSASISKDLYNRTVYKCSDSKYTFRNSTAHLGIICSLDPNISALLRWTQKLNIATEQKDHFYRNFISFMNNKSPLRTPSSYINNNFCFKDKISVLLAEYQLESHFHLYLYNYFFDCYPTFYDNFKKFLESFKDITIYDEQLESYYMNFISIACNAKTVASPALVISYLNYSLECLACFPDYINMKTFIDYYSNPSEGMTIASYLNKNSNFRYEAIYQIWLDRLSQSLIHLTDFCIPMIEKCFFNHLYQTCNIYDLEMLLKSYLENKPSPIPKFDSTNNKKAKQCPNKLPFYKTVLLGLFKNKTKNHNILIEFADQFIDTPVNKLATSQNSTQLKKICSANFFNVHLDNIRESSSIESDLYTINQKTPAIIHAESFQ